jgi:hypothetical protein
MGGALPTLIQWGDVHPCDAMPESGLALLDLILHASDTAALPQALKAAGLNGSTVHTHHAPAGLSARLRTPRGDITLTHTSP